MIIKTRSNISVIVDDSFDLSKIKGLPYVNNGYAYVFLPGFKNAFRIHRFIIGAKQGEIVDHINGDRLDNRTSNLRICSFRESNINRRVNGFHVEVKGNGLILYRARVRGPDRKVINLGSFRSPSEASSAYMKYYRESGVDHPPRLKA